MMSLPKISVIVPVYNTGERLVPTIESLLGQSLKALEIIIVNDASTDESGRVIDRLAQNNSNIIPVHFTENKGVHEARLAGLKKSTAPWVGFLDSDDFAKPSMFETLLSTAENNDVDIVVCESDRVTEQRKVIAPKLRFDRSEKIDTDVFERFCKFEFGTGMLWNKLYKRTVIEPWFELHFPWRQQINEDLVLNIGCFHNASSVFLLSDVLHEYVYVDSSVTTKMKNCWAYVQTFRAFALAATSYQHLGNFALFNVIDMYRMQLGWHDYQLSSAKELGAYQEELVEATQLLFDKSPEALSMISARQAQTVVGGKLALKSLYVIAVKKFKGIFKVSTSNIKHQIED